MGGGSGEAVAGEEGVGEVGAGAVEDVEVDAGDAAVEEFVDLGGGPFGADAFGGFGVVADGDEVGFELGGEGGLAHGAHALDLFEGEGGEESGEDGLGDSGVAACFDEVEVDLVVEEELGGGEVGAGVEFGFEVLDVGEGGEGFGMGFGVGGDAEAEVGMAGLEEVNEVDGVGEAVGGGLEGGGSFGGVAAEGHDVAVAVLVKVIGDVMEVFAAGADAGEVGHDGGVAGGAEEFADVAGALAGGAAGAVGDGDEVGAGIGEGVDGLAEGLESGVVFGGEEFEGEEGAGGLVEEGGDGWIRHNGKTVAGGGCGNNGKSVQKYLKFLGALAILSGPLAGTG